MEQINPKYVSDDNENSLKYEYFEDYLDYMIEHDMTRNYKDNLHFLSVVDEAHALINPVADGFSSNKLLAGASRWDRRCTISSVKAR